VPATDPLIALRTSLAEQLAALRGVPMDALPPALLDIAVRRVGTAYYVCPASWEQLRHEEGGAGRPVPYWARPWPSGVGLAGALHDEPPPAGTRVLELGCGLALPSVMAAKAGADVLATDGSTDAVAFAAHVLALNEVEGEVALVDWATHGDALVARGPFDLVLAADVLYTKANVEAALGLFPRLVAAGGELRIADPNRAGAARFLSHFPHQTQPGEDVSLHTVRFDGEGVGNT
jgi:predicted nicotinamide N-methyase